MHQFYINQKMARH